jgi:cellulose synthase/poly-beta-1,6-N-acetylglucosamine synthase-like glycosyltransferase
MGPGGARNLAAREAKGDIIWLVDADVVAKPGAPALIRAAFADREVGAMFGSYDEAPPAQGFWSQYKNLVHRYYHQKGDRDASTFWAGCGAIRRDVWMEVGGFDVVRFKKPSVEDIELGYRMRAAGHRIVLDPALEATHLKNWSFANVIHTDIFCRAIPWSRMLVERGKIGNDLNVSPKERGKALLAGAFLASFALVFLPFGFLAPLALAALALAINWSLLGFLAKIRGLPFALGAIAFHQIYYVYSAAAFVFCAIEHRLTRKPAGPKVSQTADRTA